MKSNQLTIYVLDTCRTSVNSVEVMDTACVDGSPYSSADLSSSLATGGLLGRPLPIKSFIAVHTNMHSVNMKLNMNKLNSSKEVKKTIHEQHEHIEFIEGLEKV